MTYFPVDRNILTSSLWAQGTAEATKVWFYLLIVANPRTGIVDDADPAIALRCALSLEATTSALDWLAAPDQFSRTKDHDGRRIERLPEGGFRVLNYVRHRDKDYSTPRVQSFRARLKAKKLEIGNDVSCVSETQETTDTDTDTTPTTPSRGGTAAEYGRLDGREDLQAVAETWRIAFGQEKRTLGVLRAARKAIEAGYAVQDLEAVVRAVAEAHSDPSAWPERSAIRWTSEHNRAVHYVLRPETLEKLIPEAHRRVEAQKPPPPEERVGPVFSGPRRAP